MSAWSNFLDQLRAALTSLEEEEVVDPFFRGQSNASWGLVPGLARIAKLENTENRLYFDFASMGSHLFPANHNSWDVLFLMQHHGLPTRLLDWSETFGVALYFAVANRKDTGDAAIWILDPYKLNTVMCKSEIVEYLDSMYPAGYERHFIDERHTEHFGKFSAHALAVAGKPRNPRMVAQRGVFTLHGDLNTPLEELVPEAIKKLVLPEEAIPDACEFLHHGGIDEHTMFPDLDGLARLLRMRELS